MAAQVNWKTESEAVEMLKGAYSKKSLQTFTRDPKRKKLPIRTTKIGRKILYSGVDIESYLNRFKDAS